MEAPFFPSNNIQNSRHKHTRNDPKKTHRSASVQACTAHVIPTAVLRALRMSSLLQYLALHRHAYIKAAWSSERSFWLSFLCLNQLFYSLGPLGAIGNSRLFRALIKLLNSAVPLTLSTTLRFLVNALALEFR